MVQSGDCSFTNRPSPGHTNGVPGALSVVLDCGRVVVVSIGAYGQIFGGDWTQVFFSSEKMVDEGQLTCAAISEPSVFFVQR